MIFFLYYIGPVLLLLLTWALLQPICHCDELYH